MHPHGSRIAEPCRAGRLALLKPHHMKKFKNNNDIPFERQMLPIIRSYDQLRSLVQELREENIQLQKERDLAERCRRDFQSENSKLKKKVQFLEKIQRKEAERQVTEDMKKPPEQQSFAQRMKNLFFRKKANNLN